MISVKEDNKMAHFEIKETNLVTGYSRHIVVAKHTSRGWTTVAKQFKTEAAAKSWITRRNKELAGGKNANTWSFEIVKANY